MRRLALFFLLLIAPSVIPASVQANHAQTLKTVAVSHGIRISLILPQRTYPKDALVVATVILQNVSQQDRFIPDWPPDWGGEFSPHILMRTSTGRLVYEEELSTFLAPTPGGFTDTFILRPGDTLTRYVRFVLEAEQLQAVARVTDGYTAFSVRPGVPTPTRSQLATHLWRVTTPFTSVMLTSEPAPRVTLSRSGERIRASVHPPWPVSGPPLYMDSTKCWFGGSVGWTQQHLPWTVAPNAQLSTPLNPHCRTSQTWHAVVGWPNHRVAFIDYTER